MIFARMIRSPMRQDPSNELVLIFDWRHQEVTLDTIRPAGAGDIVDVHIGDGRGDELSVSVCDRRVQKH
jgi:hypothetical protein